MNKSTLFSQISHLKRNKMNIDRKSSKMSTTISKDINTMKDIIGSYNIDNEVVTKLISTKTSTTTTSSLSTDLTAFYNNLTDKEIYVYNFFKNNSKWCLIFIGISFAFKQQVLFIVPFLLIMWLKKRTIRLVHFLCVPVIYVISTLPAWMMGRDFKELLLIYFDQSETYPWGTLEYPNIYALLGEAMPDMRHADEVSGAGIFMTIILLGCLAYYFYTKDINMTDELIMTLALFTVGVIVYCLPHMHDRYGFLIDILAIVYGVINIKKLPITFGFFIVSILSFMPYLIAVHIVPIQYVAIIQLGLIAYVGYDLYKQIKANSLQNQYPIL